jgi:DNA-directed RNA polymerase specialized sigma24 family protein
MCVLEVQPGVSAARSLLPAVRNEDSCDERWLVAKAKSGHEDAFGELYERHQPRTYRTALRILRNHHDAEDAVQRAFQRAIVNLERFREDSTFSTWLTRIAINEALMLLRQRRTRNHFLRTVWMPIKGTVTSTLRTAGLRLKKSFAKPNVGRHCFRQLVNFERT